VVWWRLHGGQLRSLNAFIFEQEMIIKTAGNNGAFEISYQSNGIEIEDFWKISLLKYQFIV